MAVLDPKKLVPSATKENAKLAEYLKNVATDGTARGALSLNKDLTSALLNGYISPLALAPYLKTLDAADVAKTGELSGFEKLKSLLGGMGVENNLSDPGVSDVNRFTALDNDAAAAGLGQFMDRSANFSAATGNPKSLTPEQKNSVKEQFKALTGFGDDYWTNKYLDLGLIQKHSFKDPDTGFGWNVDMDALTRDYDTNYR